MGAFFFLQAHAAERHPLVDGAVFPDLRRFTDDDAHPVVDEKPFADLGARMDFDTRDEPVPVAQPARKEQESPFPEVVGPSGAGRRREIPDSRESPPLSICRRGRAP